MLTLWDSFGGVMAGLDPAGYLALVTGISVLAQWLAWQARLPSILVLLVIGFGLGQLVRPDEVLGREVLLGGVSLAVGVILFEGSLSLRLRDVRDLGRPVIRLCTVTVAIAWVLSSASARLVGFDWEIALLIGALLVVTGPTVIAPILRGLRPVRRVSSLLRWEGIVVDPIGAVLAVLVFRGIIADLSGEALPQVLVDLGTTLLVGFGIGLGLGWVLEQLVRRHALPDFLHGVGFLAAAVGALVASNAVQPEAGLVTVTVLGVYLGNRPELHLEHVSQFKEHLQVLFVGVLFVILAGRISPGEVTAVAPQALVLVALLVLVVRPVSVLIGLAGTRVTREERRLLAFMAPRGIIAAAVSSIFGLGFAHAAQRRTEAATEATGAEAARLRASADELGALAEQAQQMVPLVFLVIVVTCAVYGLGVGRLAERLGLASTAPQGVLFVGGQPWVVAAAQVLEEAGIATLLVARDYAKLADARMAGLRTVTANILSDYAVKDMDLAGIGSLIAATDDDEVNATASREFQHVLGRANVYQLKRDPAGDGRDHRRQAAAHLTARPAFRPARTHQEMTDLVRAGWQVKCTRISGEFTLGDFRERYGPDAVLLFWLRGARVTVATETATRPADGSVVALIPPG